MTTSTTPSPTRRSIALTMAALMLMLVLAALDQTILSTALPSIARDLRGKREKPKPAKRLAEALEAALEEEDE